MFEKPHSIRLLIWFNFSQSGSRKNNRKVFEGASMEPTIKFEIFRSAKNQGKKFRRLSQISFSGILYSKSGFLTFSFSKIKLRLVVRARQFHVTSCSSYGKWFSKSDFRKTIQALHQHFTKSSQNLITDLPRKFLKIRIESYRQIFISNPLQKIVWFKV